MDQLKSLDSTIIGDIYTGNIYQQHLNNHYLGELHQLSYSLATDGVRYSIIYQNITFRKSKTGPKSYWPIWLVNNELQPEIRFKKDNIHLFGIWFSLHKPHMNTFLKPMVQMFIDGWYKGIALFFIL
jgi:hypothetical protein